MKSFKELEKKFDQLHEALEKVTDIVSNWDMALREPKEPKSGDDGPRSELRYWAQPRLKKHSLELYNEIYQWCEDNFKAQDWLGLKENQYYWFRNKKDRDWFLVKWS